MVIWDLVFLTFDSWNLIHFHGIKANVNLPYTNHGVQDKNLISLGPVEARARDKGCAI